MSRQTKISFNHRKNRSIHVSKDIIPKSEFIIDSLIPNTPNTTYTPTIKKLMVLSSSESESDSDTENDERNISKVEGRTLLNSTPSKCQREFKVHDTGVSPPKQRKQSLSRQETKLTPKKLFTPNKYSDARKALHSSLPESLPGREVELSELENFIQNHLDNKSSGSLYVSGPPGTGKTASLSKIMSQAKYKTAFRIVYVNCTTMKSASAIYTQIVRELGLKEKSSKNSKTTIENYLSRQHKMILLVLDEIDQLETKNQSVLYSIFEWSSRPKSKLILIGIANSLDLTDRMLPRLNGKCELKPKLLHFASYSKEQIENIILERLREANVTDIFAPNTVKFLAAKVAAVSGDIRRALDISRRVIEVTESHTILQSTNENGPSKTENLKSNPIDKAADMKSVLDVLKTVYGGTETMDGEYNLPLQQKLILCSLILILNKSKIKDVTLSKLHEVYRKVCKKRNINAVDPSEFVGVCHLIETRGIIKVITKKQIRSSKIALDWDEKDVEAELKDKALMADIINDTSCLC